MLNVASGFSVVVAIIALGYVLGWRKLLGRNAVYALNMYVFWLAIPATLFVFLGRTDVGNLFGPNLAVIALSTLILAAASYAVCRTLAHRQPADSLIAMLACTYTNSSNLGIPLAAHLLGDPAITLPVILFQVGLFGPLSTVFLDVSSQRPASADDPEHAGVRPSSARRAQWRLFGSMLSSVLRNPLIVSAAIGMAASFLRDRTGFALPHLVMEPIELIAGSAVPVALIAFGMSMAEVRVMEPGTSPRRSVWAATVAKTVVHPLLAWALGVWLFDASGPLLLAMVLCAALPTGQNVFTYAQRFGVNKVLARDSAVVSTVVSIPVMTVLVYALS